MTRMNERNPGPVVCSPPSQELTNVRKVLARSPNLNMPDISKQLKLMEHSEEHCQDLAAFLVDSATYANGSEDVELDNESGSSQFNSESPLIVRSLASSFSIGSTASTLSARLQTFLHSQQRNAVPRSVSFSGVASSHAASSVDKPRKQP